MRNRRLTISSSGPAAAVAEAAVAAAVAVAAVAAVAVAFVVVLDVAWTPTLGRKFRAFLDRPCRMPMPVHCATVRHSTSNSATVVITAAAVA